MSAQEVLDPKERGLARVPRRIPVSPGNGPGKVDQNSIVGFHCAFDKATALKDIADVELTQPLRLRAHIPFVKGGTQIARIKDFPLVYLIKLPLDLYKTRIEPHRRSIRIDSLTGCLRKTSRVNDRISVF